MKIKHKDMIFYILMIAFPVLQFAIFYIGVNFNSIFLSFQDYDVLTNTSTWTFSKIKLAFETMTKTSHLLSVAKTSLISYLIILAFGTPAALLFSFYIYKKMPVGATFRVLLFLPSIVSAVVMVTIYQYFVEAALPEYIRLLFKIRIAGLIENPKTRYAAIMFYNVFMNFGTTVLMYSNGMSGISPDVVESAHLDGAVGIREFWYITLPLVFSTLSTFLIIGIAGIFTNQISLYSFFGASAPENLQTYGYYLYMKTQAATSKAEYPVLAAMGLLLTFVAVPLTLIVRWLLDRFGPKEA